MPTYEYVCSKCDHQFELFQPITEKALTLCPKDLCGQKKWGKGKVARAIGAGAGIIFKGSGFYSTDYRSESYKAAAKSDTAAPGSGDAKTAAPKSEAKSETKPKPKE
jgi:putative FmdB family regulatory protein